MCPKQGFSPNSSGEVGVHVGTFQVQTLGLLNVLIDKKKEVNKDFLV